MPITGLLVNGHSLPAAFQPLVRDYICQVFQLLFLATQKTFRSQQSIINDLADTNALPPSLVASSVSFVAYSLLGQLV
jgi:hypothetical protein